MIFDDGATTLAYILPAAYFDAGQALQTSLEVKPAEVKFVLRGGADAAAGGYATTEAEKVFLPHLTKLRKIESDQSLWVEDAPPPSDKAIAWAKVVIEQLKEAWFPPTRIVASAQGGIAFCFLKGKKYADIECLNDGAILGLVSNEYDRPAAWEIDPNPADIAQASSRIRRFIEQSAAV